MALRTVIGRAVVAVSVMTPGVSLWPSAVVRPADAVTPGIVSPATVNATAAGVTTVARRRAPTDPAKPTAVQISGKFTKGQLTVEAGDDAIFPTLLGQVSWLSRAAPQTIAPKSGTLGAKYTLVVLAKRTPQQTYDLYPVAVGGPRVFRPAKQPDGKTVKAGWFYGRLSMSETLRISGVPLPEQANVISGGAGAGERIEPSHALDPAAGFARILRDVRQLMLLNGAIALLIALGLAGIAYLIRRRA